VTSGGGRSGEEFAKYELREAGVDERKYMKHVKVQVWKNSELCLYIGF